MSKHNKDDPLHNPSQASPIIHVPLLPIYGDESIKTIKDSILQRLNAQSNNDVLDSLRKQNRSFEELDWNEMIEIKDLQRETSDQNKRLASMQRSLGAAIFTSIFTLAFAITIAIGLSLEINNLRQQQPQTQEQSQQPQRQEQIERQQVIEKTQSEEYRAIQQLNSELTFLTSTLDNQKKELNNQAIHLRDVDHWISTLTITTLTLAKQHQPAQLHKPTQPTQLARPHQLIMPKPRPKMLPARPTTYTPPPFSAASSPTRPPLRHNIQKPPIPNKEAK